MANESEYILEEGQIDRFLPEITSLFQHNNQIAPTTKEKSEDIQ